MICKIMVLKEDCFFVSDGSIIFFSATIVGCTKLKIAPIIVAPIRRLILNIQYTHSSIQLLSFTSRSRTNIVSLLISSFHFGPGWSFETVNIPSGFVTCFINITYWCAGRERSNLFNSLLRKDKCSADIPLHFPN